jgi:hypothetical protein
MLTTLTVPSAVTNSRKLTVPYFNTHETAVGLSAASATVLLIYLFFFLNEAVWELRAHYFGVLSFLVANSVPFTFTVKYACTELSRRTKFLS